MDIRVVGVGAGVDADGAVGWRRGRVGGRVEQVPGFAVLFEAHLFGFAVRVEAEHRRGGADFDGNDIPEIERDDVGDEEVDVATGVDGASFAGGVGSAGFVCAGAERAGGFGLNADELASVVEDEVVALAVSPGLGDTEAEAGGFVEEGGFGALSGALGVAGADEAGESWTVGVLWGWLVLEW